ncbi:nudix hydrolase 20, chloroplastic isoform X2 [Ricinus communis]|uniref:nudix hydrolase 20, chloroplastic isoform X2 n=1 Tax=Ricinus communis TaxID=3988 RepID=UPI000D6A02C2|nr:nudix hydrolase 20, chloroplastic isoform X2 [Ricinus communis]|eukprot:XP_025012478.1 nudix hydrolase 20, chloroplastic isoform X2 [Ricinus communis]
MACSIAHRHHHLFTQSIHFSFPSLFMSKSFISHPSKSTRSFCPIKSTSRSMSVISGASSFTWDDVFRVSQPEYVPNDSSDLSGFFHKIQLCNRGSELQSEFISFLIEDQFVGYERLQTAEDRTRAVGQVIKCLGEEGLIPGIRNELYPVVSSFGSPVYFSLERAAAPYFGIKVYGIHMNGFVERDGEKFLWIGKRSGVKPTYPGMLDHLVAGGLPHGISCEENVIKECEEEAGIPRSISHKAIPVGAVSYMDIEEYRYKRDVLFCYDLKLPDGFIPKNQDGEVESFQLIPVKNVANVVRRTEFFKSNCSLVIIHFLFRHGFIRPECLGYLDLLQSLRNGDCS